MTSRPAALPMYDFDREAVHAWWSRVASAARDEGVQDVPSTLDWPSDLDAHWRDERLLLSQTCGYPAANDLRDIVQVIGAFRYTAPGCSDIRYRSELMVRQDDPGRTLADYRGRVAAFNDLQSHSGFHGLRARVKALGAGDDFFGRTVESGSHRASLAMLQDGRADIAAIDCITLAGLRRNAPELAEGLRAVGHTELAPGLPVITSGLTTTDDLARLRRALRVAIADPALAAVRGALFIDDFVVVDNSAWAGMRAVAA